MGECRTLKRESTGSWDVSTVLWSVEHGRMPDSQTRELGFLGCKHCVVECGAWENAGLSNERALVPGM